MINPIDILCNKYDHLQYWFITHKFKTVDCLIDIGAGDHPQEIIKVRRWQVLVDPSYETNEYYINGSSYKIKGDWGAALEFLQNQSFDCVTLIDVIEHLKKTDALKLLSETQKYVRQIVVFTPLGFMGQEDGEWNTHRSGWIPSDFKEGWRGHIFPDFHWCDFKGKAYQYPWPAMLVIWKKESSA
jgi:hypothetical protein